MVAHRFRHLEEWPAWKFWCRHYLELATIAAVLAVIVRAGLVGLGEGAVELHRNGFTSAAFDKLHLGLCTLFAVFGVAVCVWTWDDFGVNVRRRAAAEEIRRRSKVGAQP